TRTCPSALRHTPNVAQNSAKPASVKKQAVTHDRSRRFNSAKSVREAASGGMRCGLPQTSFPDHALSSEDVVVVLGEAVGFVAEGRADLESKVLPTHANLVGPRLGVAQLFLFG